MYHDDTFDKVRDKNKCEAFSNETASSDLVTTCANPSALAVPEANPTLAFMRAMFSGIDASSRIEIRVIPEKVKGKEPPAPADAKARSFWSSTPEDAARIALEQDALATAPTIIAVGVAPRQHYGTKGEHVTEVVAFQVDRDLRDGETTDDALAAVKAYMSPPPSIAVASGRGVHAYWLFTKPIRWTPDQRDTRIRFVKLVNQALADAIGGDPSAVDVARVLRVPGTRHRKDPADPRLVSILTDLTDFSRRYDPKTFVDLAKAQAAKDASPRKPTAPQATAFSTTATVQMNAASMRATSALVNEQDYLDIDTLPFPLPTWVRESIKSGTVRQEIIDKTGKPDRSRRDLGVVSYLIRRGFNPSQILAIFSNDKIGDKYQEEMARGGGDRYLTMIFDKVGAGLSLPLPLRSCLREVFSPRTPPSKDQEDNDQADKKKPRTERNTALGVPPLGSPRDTAALICNWFFINGATLLRDEGIAFLIYGDEKVRVDGTDAEFHAFMVKHSGLNLTDTRKEIKGNVIATEMRAAILNVGLDPYESFFAAVTDFKAKKISVALDRRHTVLLEPGKATVQVQQRGRRYLDLGGFADPWTFCTMDDAAIKDGLAQLQSHVVDLLPVADSARWMVISLVLTTIMKDLVTSRPLLRMQGPKSAGKTVACQLLTTVLYGHRCPTATTTASNYFNAREPIWFLDNVEKSNLTDGLANFLLQACTGTSRQKMKDAATTLDQAISTVPMANGIECQDIEELTDRTLLFECAKKFQGQMPGEREVLEDIMESRTKILGAIVSVIAQDVLPVVASKGVGKLATEFISRNRDFARWRVREYVALAILLVEGMLKRLGIPAEPIVTEWVKLINENASKSASLECRAANGLDLLLGVDPARIEPLVKSIERVDGRLKIVATSKQVHRAIGLAAGDLRQPMPYKSASQLMARLVSEASEVKGAGWTREACTTTNGIQFWEFTREGEDVKAWPKLGTEKDDEHIDLDAIKL